MGIGMLTGGGGGYISSLSDAITDSASLAVAVDSFLAERPRLRPTPTLGVRLDLTFIFVFRPTAWTSKAPGPCFELILYTCTARSLLCVAMYSFIGSQATPWTKWLCSAISRTHLPSADEKIRAVLSVLPAMMYSPVGLHARSYTCIVVQRNGVRAFQNSFSYECSSGSEP